MSLKRISACWFKKNCQRFSKTQILPVLKKTDFKISNCKRIVWNDFKTSAFNGFQKLNLNILKYLKFQSGKLTIISPTHSKKTTKPCICSTKITTHKILKMTRETHDYLLHDYNYCGYSPSVFVHQSIREWTFTVVARCTKENHEMTLWKFETDCIY